MAHTPGKTVRLLMIGDAPDDGAGWLRVGSPDEALRRVRESRPRAVLLHLDGAPAAQPCIEVIEELRRRQPRVALLVLATGGDERVERLVRAAGAHCYADGGPETARFAQVLARLAPHGAAPPRRTAVRLPEARANGPPRAPAAAGVLPQQPEPFPSPSTPMRGGEFQ